MTEVDLTEFDYKPAPHIKVKLALGGHRLRCERCGQSVIVPENGEKTLEALIALAMHPFISEHEHIPTQ